jgi:uncharacterized repeat protein (TIGR01451 family)
VDITRNDGGPALHMPIAVNGARSTDGAVFSKTVDLESASPGDVLTYTIDLVNGQLDGTIDLRDAIPPQLIAIPGTETESVADGATISPFTIAASGDAAQWRGTLNLGSISVDAAPGTSPAGFLPLSIFGIAPVGCPSNCDDGGWIFGVPAFTYNGETYTDVIVSVNGTIEAGSSSGIAASASIAKQPSDTPPDNLLAPLWTDLNLLEGGEFYIGILNDGVNEWTVYEWNNVAQWGTGGAESYSFQVWIQNDDSGNIWFVYDALGDLSYASVGAENADGSIGSSYYYSGDGTGTPPALGDELQVNSVTGGTASFSFQAEVSHCGRSGLITNKAKARTSTTEETAIAVTECSEPE